MPVEILIWIRPICRKLLQGGTSSPKSNITVKAEQEIYYEDEIEGIVGRKPTVVGWGKTDAYQLKSWDGVGSKIQQKLEVFQSFS